MPSRGLGRGLGFTRYAPRSRGVLSRAVAYWTAESFDAGNNVVSDLSGNGYDLTAVNLIHLPYNGSNYVYIPNVPGNLITRDRDGLVVSTPGNHLEGCEVISSTQVRDADGDTWTITRATDDYDHRTAIVDRTMLLFGSHTNLGSAYAYTQDAAAIEAVNAGTGDLTAVAFFRYHGDMGYGAQVLSHRYNRDGTAHPTTGGWQLNDEHVYLEHTTTDISPLNARYDLPTGVPVMAAGVIDRTNHELRGYRNDILGEVVPFDPLFDATGPSTFYIGRAVAPSSYGTFEFFGAAVFKEALSQQDLTILAVEMGVEQDF